MTIRPTKSEWESLLFQYGGLMDASKRQDMMNALSLALAVDQKLAATDLELFPFTPEQETARIVLSRWVQATTQQYIDPKICTFARHAPNEPLTLCFHHDPGAFRYLPWCDETVCDSLKASLKDGSKGRYWEVFLSGAVPATDPFAKAAVETGYLVVVSGVNSSKLEFEVLSPSQWGLGKYSDPDAAWAAALQDYLAHFCKDVDRGERVDLEYALKKAQVIKLPGEENYFVVSDVEYSATQKLQTLMGWRVDASGFKVGGNAAVGLAGCNLQALTHSEFNAIRDEGSEPYISGKGALNCSIHHSDGTVAREVSLKARLDFSHFSVTPQGEPFLVKPAGLNYPFAFDPFTQADPQTGEAYTQFCFVDDGGLVLGVDPKTRVAHRQDMPADTATTQLMDAPAG